MDLLHWDSRYSVGIAAVDHEHRELIELINRLYDEATSRGSKDAVLDFFGDLFKAISAHFALEERFMRERGYDQLVQHKNDHERLLDEIRDIMEDFEASEGSMNVCLRNGLMRGFPGISRPMTRGCTARSGDIPSERELFEFRSNQTG